MRNWFFIPEFLDTKIAWYQFFDVTKFIYWYQEINFLISRTLRLRYQFRRPYCCTNPTLKLIGVILFFKMSHSPPRNELMTRGSCSCRSATFGSLASLRFGNNSTSFGTMRGAFDEKINIKNSTLSKIRILIGIKKWISLYQNFHFLISRTWIIDIKNYIVWQYNLQYISHLKQWQA